MATVKHRYSKEEFARRGDQIYETQVQPRLNTKDEGKFAAIDIETANFEVADDELEAGAKLRAPPERTDLDRARRFARRASFWGPCAAEVAMITGLVRGDEAWIRLKVFGIRGREKQIEALIDTGYTTMAARKCEAAS